MARPLLGIIACNRVVGAETGQAVMNRYTSAVMRHADVAALIIPSMPDHLDIAEVLPRFDGILLTGSPSNIAPARYGAATGDGPFDEPRDATALRLIEAAMAAGKPLFGICRGFQEVNVALGGTLRGDCAASADLLRHHAPDGTPFDDLFDHSHPVSLTPGGVLAGALGCTELTVNSVHFQGVAALAPPLTVEAVAPDGLVEAVRADGLGAPLLAVQWHPEWRPETRPDRLAFFALMGRVLRGERW